jgi:N-acetylglucosaminyldiphosphoundecaprenol N-acetyl-beta-D-mannosaminyltransferase
MDSVKVLGLRVDRTSMGDALAQIETFIAERGQPRHVVTADASMVVTAREDPDLKKIVDSADLVTPDGAGILWHARLLKRPITHKVSGVDLVAELCRLSAEKGYRIYFLGAAPGVAEEAADNLRTRYPGAMIVGTHDGYFSKEQEPGVIEEIKAARPDVLFVAFGIPKQEKWIRDHKQELGVPVSAGIGGSFDVYSGRVKRAPVVMQRAGFEWLYRLWCNPKKIGKVMTLPRFAMLTIRERLGVRTA